MCRYGEKVHTVRRSESGVSSYVLDQAVFRSCGESSEPTEWRRQSQFLPKAEPVQLVPGLREHLCDLWIAGLEPGRDPEVLGGSGKVLFPDVQLTQVGPNDGIRAVELDGLSEELGRGDSVAGLVQRPGKHAQRIHHRPVRDVGGDL